MKHTIKKHANNKFLVTVSKIPYSNDREYEPFHDLYFHSHFYDVKRFLYMEDYEGVDKVFFTMKADLETFEIVLAILEDKMYYNIQGLKDIIEEIRNA